MNSYATGPGSRVYHIVVKRGGYTLCGLKVIGLKSVLPDKGSGLLYVVREEPKDRPLCKHCQRLKQSSNS